MLTSYLRVEIYLTELKLAKYPDVEKTALRKFSKRDNLGIGFKHFSKHCHVRFLFNLTLLLGLAETVEKVICELFNIPDNSNIHLWTKSVSNVYEELPQKKVTIQELSLMSNQTIVAEVQNPDGTWPKKVLPYSKRYNRLILIATSLFGS